jgi:hypothetical protein
MLKHYLRTAIALSACAFAAAHAETIYDNSQNNLAIFYPSTNEYGDQVTVKDGQWTLTDFDFGYFGNIAAPAGDEKGRLRLYYNDGVSGETSGLPQTLFYDSGYFSLNSGWQTVSADKLSIPLLHNTFTWTVEFTGVSGEVGDRAGLISYDPPVVGSSQDDFWEKRNGNWTLVELPTAPSNFGARFDAVARPSIPKARIESISKSGSTATIQAKGIAGKIYSLEYKTSLDATQWTRETQARATSSIESFALVDANAATPARFYRLAESDSSISYSNNGATVVSYAVPGLRYALEVKDDLSQAWSRITGAEQTALGQTVSFTDATAGSKPLRFYRVVQI